MWLTGWDVLDALTAMVMGGRLVRESIARLIDDENQRCCNASCRPCRRPARPPGSMYIICAPWRSGPRYHVDFHLTSPRYWDLEHGHDVSESIELFIQHTQSTLGDVIIHIGPSLPGDCSFCAVPSCSVRTACLSRR